MREKTFTPEELNLILDALTYTYGDKKGTQLYEKLKARLLNIH